MTAQGLDGGWLVGGRTVAWAVAGQWLGGGWAVAGRWLGGGWAVAGRWLGGGWAVAWAVAGDSWGTAGLGLIWNEPALRWEWQRNGQW
jgi:hypothetical protein